MVDLQTMPLRFRVWDKEEQKLLVGEEAAFFIVAELSEEDSDSPVVSLESRLEIGKGHDISQDTGLKDKNGKSIYTGDVCFYAPYERYVPVFYKDGMAVIKIREFEEYYASQHLEGLEVIGTIWQNPELLEEK